LKQATTRNPFYGGPAPGWLAVSRGAALGFSGLLVLNLLEVFVHSTSAVQNWFTRLDPLTQPVGITVLSMAATALLMFAMRPALPGPVWLASIGTVVVLAGFCGKELWQISQSVPEPMRTTAMARPLGIVMLLAVAGMGILLGNASSVRGRSSFLAILFSSILTIAGFAVVTIQSGGVSDSLPSAPVPVILAFGCPLDSDGKPSEELTDRVKTASGLLLEKQGDMLVFSGAHDAEFVSRNDAMQELATEAGVADSSIVMNPNVGNTAASIQFLESLPELKEDRRIIAVSHWYELSRIRLLARRSGLAVSAIAAEQEHALFNQNRLVAREVADLLKTLCEPAVEFGRQFVRPVDPVEQEQ